MLVDKRNKALNTFEYSLVQFHNMWTKEVINIGVILSDGDNNYIHMPKRLDKLVNCFDFEEKAGINYTIDIIRDRIENQKFIPYGEASNAVFITDAKSFKTDQLAEQALYEAVDKFMMVSKLRAPDTDGDTVASKYDKLSILRLIEKRAEAKKIENFMHHRRFDGVAKKIIDMALVDKDARPYSIANIASIHVGKFDDNFIHSIWTLQEAMRRDFVKDQFLYVPVMKTESSLRLDEKKSLGWAKEQARYINVDLITDKRQDAVLERLQQYKPVIENTEELVDD